MDKIIRYWIKTSKTGAEHKSALKVVATPKSYMMTVYNKKFPDGKLVDGTVFYKISIGEDPDYDVVAEAKFKEYIKTIK